jgi:hypothetical protein
LDKPQQNYIPVDSDKGFNDGFVNSDQSSPLDHRRSDTYNCRIILLGDFIASGFKWESGPPPPRCRFYSQLSGDAAYTSTCPLDLRQCIEAADSHN